VTTFFTFIDMTTVINCDQISFRSIIDIIFIMHQSQVISKNKLKNVGSLNIFTTYYIFLFAID
jgi:hypothetical protein